MVIADPDFWGNPEDSQKQLLKRRSQLEESLQQAEQYQSSLGDLAALIELQDEGEDARKSAAPRFPEPYRSAAMRAPERLVPRRRTT